MNAIFTQAIYYGIVILITIFIMGGVQRGFFFKYIKVRTSMGKYVMLKVMSKMRDYYLVGNIEGNQVKFTYKKDKKKIDAILTLPKDKKVDYRSLGISWIDVDEETMGVVERPSNDLVSTNDVESTDQLLRRRIEEPQKVSSLEKLIAVGILALILICAAGAYFAYKGTVNDTVLINYITANIGQIKPQIITATNI